MSLALCNHLISPLAMLQFCATLSESSRPLSRDAAPEMDYRTVGTENIWEHDCFQLVLKETGVMCTSVPYYLLKRTMYTVKELRTRLRKNIVES